jgi:carbonic anhydrase
MKELTELLANNLAWSEGIKARDPGFFDALAKEHIPRYLWIGCSDSRVPATQLVGLGAGDLFVHRNVANLVIHTDFNCLSVLQYAVDVLKVEHVIVCGHHGCGGVQAALHDHHLGLLDNWLRHVQDTVHHHASLLSKIADETERVNKLCELNVIEQVLNVSRTTIVETAWERGQELTVHGLIFGIKDGLLRDLGIRVANEDELTAAYESAIQTQAATTAR